jgi:hypothetical protein
MHSIRHAPVLTLLYAASVGCGSDGESSPVSPSPAPATLPQLKATVVQQQVTGVAFITLVEADNAAERFTFSAIRHHDGRFSGQFQLFTEQEGGIRLHGTVSCLGVADIDGELVAHLGGTITQSSAPGFEGVQLMWTAVDEGEGGAAPPDLASDLFIPESPEQLDAFCALEFGLPVNQSSRGNIQVHL